jgi:ribose 5-phosphate isomerase A
VEDGMSVGLGTGSTAKIAIDILGRMVASGLNIKGIPTSERSARQALDLKIPLTDLEETPQLDVTIDGADQVQVGSFSLIKGLGGALLREKIVAFATKCYLIVVDESKIVSGLGGKVPVPVEIVKFGWTVTAERLKRIGADPQLRKDQAGAPYISDGGNYIVDCRFDEIVDPPELEANIKKTLGVVDCGLFLGLSPTVIVGTSHSAYTL